MKNISIYIHIPFCLKKCNYCDFYSIEIGKNKEFSKFFIKSLKKEINLRLSKLDNFNVKSIYIGGGTPSILNEKSFEIIFKEIGKFFNVNKIKEITIEANPETVENKKFKTLKDFGVNRVSLGAQTFNDKSLIYLGRIHNSKKIYEAIDILKSLSYENINLDLIYGIPYENLKTVKDNLIKAINLKPTHISVYNLEYHKNTKMYDDLNAKKISKWSEEREKESYLLIKEILANSGFTHYEISNFAIKGYKSIHNLNYWSGGEYLGFGPMAYSFIEGNYYKNGDIYFYINSINKNLEPFLQREVFSKKNLKKMIFILNLRLISGVNLKRFKNIFLENDFIKKVDDLLNDGLLIKKENNLRLSEQGILISNKVFSYLL